ncbi:hypothetical protein SPRG_12902 [Saprolegnia parasitica CBS 223.65]|uniref:Uncharacterized protein n=1 Tax=Saprolegnia parasitica (strain CBS 223.65) TaxID=695850 RepID=A0A067C3J4_SAPPC|nr:hypothetical protein SPRG_12902 [Saprolegnia parasitica CBS 223.65]KDO21121.1 hypothetical protein SPRG_12902 [Saprolegnia parasitica CBS 223.65]|eukprot:XP_012208122.1 hypothetical protein SPRG_12902 [Saprolegnia parasitica CBS 223.65]
MPASSGFHAEAAIVQPCFSAKETERGLDCRETRVSSGVEYSGDWYLVVAELLRRGRYVKRHLYTSPHSSQSKHVPGVKIDGVRVDVFNGFYIRVARSIALGLLLNVLLGTARTKNGVFLAKNCLARQANSTPISLSNVQSHLQTQQTDTTIFFAISDVVSVLNAEKPGGSSDDIRDTVDMVTQEYMVVQDSDRTFSTVSSTT